MTVYSGMYEKLSIESACRGKNYPRNGKVLPGVKSEFMFLPGTGATLAPCLYFAEVFLVWSV